MRKDTKKTSAAPAWQTPEEAYALLPKEGETTDDAALLLAALDHMPDCIDRASPTLLANKAFIAKASQITPKILAFASPTIQADEDFFLSLVAENYQALEVYIHADGFAGAALDQPDYREDVIQAVEKYLRVHDDAKTFRKLPIFILALQGAFKRGFVHKSKGLQINHIVKILYEAAKRLPSPLVDLRKNIQILYLVVLRAGHEKLPPNFMTMLLGSNGSDLDNFEALADKFSGYNTFIDSMAEQEKPDPVNAYLAPELI